MLTHIINTVLYYITRLQIIEGRVLYKSSWFYSAGYRGQFYTLGFAVTADAFPPVPLSLTVTMKVATIVCCRLGRSNSGCSVLARASLPQQ